MYVRAIEAVAPSISVKVATTPVHDDAEIESAFSRHAREQGGGLIVMTDTLYLGLSIARSNDIRIIPAARRCPLYPRKSLFDFRSRAQGQIAMNESQFVPPDGAFARTVPIRFSHCDPAGVVYFPHYFDIFNGLIEYWYTEQLGVDYSKLILGDRHGFPYVHIETDFKKPSRMGEHLDLTLLLTQVGRSSLSVVIVGHIGGVERLRARLVTAMTSLETQRSVPLPQALRQKFETYMKGMGQA